MLTFHNCLKPFFQGVTAEMAAGGAPPPPLLLQVQQGQGVPLPVRAGAEHRLVAAQLHIPAGQDIHGPDQGIEPVEAQRGGEKGLPQRVKTPDMGVFVGQDAGQGVPVPQIHGAGQQDHGIQRAVGQGRGDAVAGPDLHRTAQGMGRQPVQDEAVPAGQGGGVEPAAAQMAPQEARRQQQRGPQPEAEQDRVPVQTVQSRPSGEKGAGGVLRQGGEVYFSDRRRPLRGMDNLGLNCLRGGGPDRQVRKPAADAQWGGNLHRNQQAEKRQVPQQAEGPPGRPVLEAQPQDQDRQNHYGGGEGCPSQGGQRVHAHFSSSTIRRSRAISSPDRVLPS